MLVNLTKVTRDNLRDVEGSLWALWATAQQINARQKVELSIRFVFSRGLKYGIMTHKFFDLLAKASRASFRFFNYYHLTYPLSQNIG